MERDCIGMMCVCICVCGRGRVYVCARAARACVCVRVCDCDCDCDCVIFSNEWSDFPSYPRQHPRVLTQCNTFVYYITQQYHICREVALEGCACVYLYVCVCARACVCV